LIPLINAAFAIETFQEGKRTDEARLAVMMRKGYLGQLAVDPAHQCKGWVVKGHRRVPQVSIAQS
jgi:hypothetical protein